MGETAEMPGRSMARTWAPRLLGGAGLALVPWTVVLARTLPSTYEARNWSLAWVGLDCAMAAGALGSALLHRAGDRRAGVLASATATTALVDVWFDVTTSGPGWPLVQALACGVVELAFAGFCAAVALDAVAPSEIGVAPPGAGIGSR